MNSLKNIRSVIRIFEHIRYILNTKQKIGSIIVFISMIVCSLLELLGVSLIYPFLMMMLDADSMRDKIYLKWIYSRWPQIDNTSVIIILAICLAIIYICKNAMAILCRYIQLTYSTRINSELSVKMLKSYMMRPYEYFVDTESQYIMRGLSGDVGSVYGIISNGFIVFSETFTIIMIIAYLVKVDIFIALVSMISGAFCFLAVTIGFKGLMKRLGRESRRLDAESPGYTYQLINGIKEITVLDRKDYFVDTYDSFQRKRAKINRKTGVVDAMPDRVIEAVCVAIIMLVLCLRIKQGVNLQLFLPTLGAFGMGMFRIMPSISKLSGRINNIVYLLPGLDNAYEIMREAEQLEKEYEYEETQITDFIRNNGYNEISFEKEIILNNVHWKYENSPGDVLKGLNLVIKRGESIGLIGSSGGGKSTLVDVFMTLFKPQSGSITMDGVDIFLMKYRWRKLIGYVPQAVYLTGDSVRNNVAFGLPDDQISDEKVWKALEQAQLKDYIEALPDKLETSVGERGVKFSGGQRQRVAIARALYNEPEILILDEATAALDNETEKAFMEAIESLQGEKTIILVAHRLTTVRNCDRVYEIKDGIAIERNVQDVVSGK